MRVRTNGILRATALAAVAALSTGAAPLRASAQQETPPPPQAPHSTSFPKPAERTLGNGLRVIVVERHETPLAAMQLMIKSGGEVDPAGLSGLADMTASLLTKGTATRSASQIVDQIEALGGSIGSSAGWDQSNASVDVLSSKAAPAMEILADVVRKPAFNAEELERLRTQTLDDLTVALSQPRTIARYVAARATFGDSAYGHPLGGTPESLAKITRDDIVKLHSTYYRPDNAILVVGGDVKADDVFTLAEKLFGNWAKPAAPLAMATAATDFAPKNADVRIVVVDKPDAGQAAVYLTRQGINRTDADYFRGTVANTVLGGGYSARLNQEVRIKRGLSYGASSTLDARRNVGPFVAATQTKNPSAAEVVGLLVSELRRLGSAPVPDDEMTPRKATLVGNYARNLETVGGAVGQVANLALQGIDLGQINTYITSVQAVTGADVQKFASSRLGMTGTTVVVVGKGSDFLDALKKQFPNVEVINVADLDLNSAKLKK